MFLCVCRLFSAHVQRVVRDDNALVTCVEVTLLDNGASLSQHLVDGGYAQWRRTADVTPASPQDGGAAPSAGVGGAGLEDMVEDVIWSAISLARYKVQGD